MKQAAIAFDQLVNCCIYISGDGWGWADETISARLFRCYLQGLIGDIWYRAIDALMFWDADHCFHSWRAEIERHQMPKMYSVTCA